MTGLIAPIVEAYGELRVNKGRIMLALIGVALSVFILTGVMGAGGMLGSALEQSVEKSAGRASVVGVYHVGGGGPELTADERDEIVLEQIDRLGIEHRTRVINTLVRAQTRQGVQTIELQGVDPGYADIYRVRPESGRWIADSDQNRLAPAIVVNQPAYELLGRPAMGTEPITLYGQAGNQQAVQAVVIGVLPADPTTDWGPTAYTAAGSIDEMPGMDQPGAITAEYRAWVPPEQAQAVSNRLSQVLADTPAGSFEAAQYSAPMEGFEVLQRALIAVALAILLLGAMGLVNISLVTVRYRVREIGIRRSYGATGGRIFFGVLMESVVATVVAGAIGVMGAVALVKAPFVTDYFRGIGLVDLPPFPVGAVVAGLAAATLVGVLAGALPAIIATRIKVIDAIRS